MSFKCIFLSKRTRPKCYILHSSIYMDAGKGKILGTEKCLISREGRG